MHGRGLVGGTFRKKWLGGGILLAALLAVVATATGQPPKAPEVVSVHDTLLKQGYVPVKMTRLENLPAHMIDMTIGGETLRMLVSPSMPVVLIHTAAADRLKLARNDESLGTLLGQFQTPELAAKFRGSKFPVVETGFVRYSVGSVSGGYLLAAITDLRRLVEMTGYTGPPIDGVLGANYLLEHAAQLVYETDTLYLRPPNLDTLAALAGKWTCTAGEEAEGPMDAAKVAAISLEFDNDRAHLRTRKMDHHCFVWTELKDGCVRLTLYRGGHDAATANQLCGGPWAIYHQAGDEMTICVQLDGSTECDWDAMPTDFKPKPGYVVLHLKRDKPAPKP